jgi:hypothetical protein
MADDSQGTKYTLFSDRSTVDIQSWITRDNRTSSVNRRASLKNQSPVIQEALLKDGSYLINKPLPLPQLVAPPSTTHVIDGITYELSAKQYQQVRAILDAAIRISDSKG